jgi:hypothetical protein
MFGKRRGATRPAADPEMAATIAREKEDHDMLMAIAGAIWPFVKDRGSSPADVERKFTLADKLCACGMNLYEEIGGAELEARVFFTMAKALAEKPKTRQLKTQRLTSRNRAREAPSRAR